MRLFNCQNCGNTVFFENTHCEQCNAVLGFIPASMQLSALVGTGDKGWTALSDTVSPPPIRYYCANHQHQVCNWLVESEENNALCIACEMNRYIPKINDAEKKLSWQKLEFSKHRLMYSLLRLQLPLQSKAQNPDTGLAFDFIANDQPVPQEAKTTTGHADGQVTINISEASSSQREQARVDMNERYRTLIGHFRHEVGHYYWDVLVAPNEQWLQDYRNLFGDERQDYGTALNQHYNQGPPANWSNHFVSAYASSHPWEDWAESWAHYFHIIDTLETAHAFGLALGSSVQSKQTYEMVAMVSDIDPYTHPQFGEIIQRYIPLTLAINSLNRAMGQPDLYPFVLNDIIINKLEFVHRLVKNTQNRSSFSATDSM